MRFGIQEVLILRLWPEPSVSPAQNAVPACRRLSGGDTARRNGSKYSEEHPAPGRKPRGSTRSLHTPPPTDRLPLCFDAADAALQIASGPRSYFIRTPPRMKDAVALTLTKHQEREAAGGD